MDPSDLLPGQADPIGATVTPDGVNFSLYSKHCTQLELLLFDAPGAPRPARTIALDPQRNRTYHYWHIHVRGLRPGQVYAYRARGPFVPAEGLRFDPAKVLLDPYARAVCHGDYQREAARQPGDNAAHALRGVIADPADYDWEGDAPLQRANRPAVIYEMHVGGFTR